MGPNGWQIVDFSTLPPRLNGDYIRDEGEQAREVADLLATFAEAGVYGTFVFAFVQPLNPYSEDPRYDLDMAAYSLVKSFGSRLGDVASLLPEVPWDTTRMGTAYPGMPWEPKQSFRAVADAYRPCLPAVLTGRAYRPCLPVGDRALLDAVDPAGAQPLRHARRADVRHHVGDRVEDQLDLQLGQAGAEAVVHTHPAQA
jgi:hypothetical protein